MNNPTWDREIAREREIRRWRILGAVVLVTSLPGGWFGWGAWKAHVERADHYEEVAKEHRARADSLAGVGAALEGTVASLAAEYADSAEVWEDRLTAADARIAAATRRAAVTHAALASELSEEGQALLEDLMADHALIVAGLSEELRVRESQVSALTVRVDSLTAALRLRGAEVLELRSAAAADQEANDALRAAVASANRQNRRLKLAVLAVPVLVGLAAYGQLTGG